MQSRYTVLGLMSGSSLDGLDLALCHFRGEKGHWKFSIEASTTIPFDPEILDMLKALTPDTPSSMLAATDLRFGTWMGEKVKEFLGGQSAKPDLVASHGHTVLHEPKAGYTLQIGNGEALAASCHLSVVSDFRTKDVVKGGQGAPLVPIGDELLFGEYSACLNIGGIANISMKKKQRVAWDICPANLLINDLAKRAGKESDKDGAMARSGTLRPALMEELDGLHFYRSGPPKSLDRLWYEDHMRPLFRDRTYSLEDLLRTATEHIGEQIGKTLRWAPAGEILVTGGGARNGFLMERIAHHANRSLEASDPALTDQKEALIFAFIGMLRARGETNILASVTGASSDSIGGHLHHPE